MPRPIEILTEREDRWRAPLSAVSLAAELELERRDVAPVVKSLGMLYDGARYIEDKLSVLAKHPACVVVGLAGLGALDYRQGNYWSGVWETAGIPPGQQTSTHWGNAFLSGLRQFDLPQFDELPLPYVGPVLMHAGVPDYSLADLLQLMLRRQQVDPDLTGDRFVEWATQPGRGSRLFELDKPVQRFLLYGGEYSQDFVERCFDLLDRLREPSPDFDGVRLPARIIAKARELLADGTLDLHGRRRGGRARRRADQPRLALDPFGQGLTIKLPPVGDQPDGAATWHVTVNGAQVAVRSRSAWPGASETAPATTFPLRQPARTVLVSLAGSEHLQHEIPVIDPADPLLIFAEDGRRIPVSTPVPPEMVWLLHPDESLADERPLVVVGQMPVQEAVPAPYGWDGWCLRRVDLADVSSLGLEGSRPRPVRGFARPRLELAAPIPGLRTMYDSPVYAEPPSVVLPGGSDVAVGWTITVQRPYESSPLSSLNVESTGSTRVDPWVKVPRPLVGPYELTLRGPLGRGLSRSLELVEGLAITCDPPWREFTNSGLSPSQLSLAASAGVRVQPNAVALHEREPQTQIEVAGLGCTEVLVFEPPHMAAQALGMEAGGRWSTAPLRLVTEAFDEPGVLLVSLPSAVKKATLLVRVGGEVVQSTEADALAVGQPVRFQLNRVADTIREAGAASLEIELVKRAILVARCQPRRLAVGASLDGADGVVFDGTPDIDNLFAGVYPVLYPWRDAGVLEVHGGRTAALPSTLRGCGSLRIMLRVDDPWLPAPWPAWPNGENVFTVTVPLRESGGRSTEDAIAGYLAGEGSLAPSPADFGFLYSVYEREADLAQCGVRQNIRRDVAAALAESPQHAVRGVAATRATPAAITAALVESGTVFAPLPHVLDPEEVGDLWVKSPLAGALASGGLLDAGGDAADALVERIASVCGAAAAELIAGKSDPYAGVGRFGPAEAQLAGRPREVLDMVWRASRIAPAALLDADSRVVAARELFEARTHPRMRAVLDGQQVLVQHVTALVERLGRPRLTEAIAARRSQPGWQSLPALSIALAIASRLASRGDGLMMTKLAGCHAKYTALARRAPSMVQLDLVLAELLVGAHE